MSDFEFTVANYVWEIEHKLSGTLFPLTAKLTYYFRSAEVPVYEQFEDEMIDLCFRKQIKATRGYQLNQIFHEMHEWLLEQESERSNHSEAP